MNPITEELLTSLIFKIPLQKIQELINKDINLVDYFKRQYSAFIPFIYGFLINKPNILNELKSITKKDLINIIKKNSELYKIIESKKGKGWFKKQDFSKFFSI